MSVTSSAAQTARAARAPLIGAKSAVHDPRQFWAIEFKRQTANPQFWKRAFHVLVNRVMVWPGEVLYGAVESGVPTRMVDLIAGATGEPVTRIMDVIGVSQTTYRRKDESHEPLPDAAGHRTWLPLEGQDVSVVDSNGQPVTRLANPDSIDSVYQVRHTGESVPGYFGSGLAIALCTRWFQSAKDRNWPSGAVARVWPGNTSAAELDRWRSSWPCVPGPAV